MVRKTELLDDALLSRYSIPGHYTDCYVADCDGDVPLDTFVTAFYTTWLFRLERWVLKVAADKPSGDADIAAMLTSRSQAFAAWTVEARADNQLLLCDFRGRTRSWFMVSNQSDTEHSRTRLSFGSAVMPAHRPANGEPSLGFAVQAFLPLHRLYARSLLALARRSLVRARD